MTFQGVLDMKQAIYEHLYDLENTSISIHYYSNRGSYFPAHWHPAIELLYILNGTAEIIVGGVKHTLVPGEFIVVDSNQIHESQCALASMGVTVHVSKEFLESYIEDTALPGINCMRDTLQKEKLPNYLEICNLFKKLVPMYIQHPAAMRLGSDAIVMEILFHLINHFSYQLPASQIPGTAKNQERLQEILLYVEENYRHPILLEDIAGKFGLNREYFCRFFKQQMGINFTRHVNQVRISHIHHDLVATEDPIMEIIDRNGFTNYKLFHKLFREIYGCTPREARQESKEIQETSSHIKQILPE